MPLDDVLGCLRDSNPTLTRSSLHRCLERHAISRLPDDPNKASMRGRFAKAATGTFPTDVSELRLAEGRPNMLLDLDRVSKPSCVGFRHDAGTMNGADVLRGVVAASSCATHTVLTDNAMAFADLPRDRNGSTWRHLGAHIVDRVRVGNAIARTPTRPCHPWTNDQADQAGRTVRDATLRMFHFPGLESPRALRWRALRGRMPRLEHHRGHLQARSPSPHPGTRQSGVAGNRCTGRWLFRCRCHPSPLWTCPLCSKVNHALTSGSFSSTNPRRKQSIRCTHVLPPFSASSLSPR